MDEQKFEELFRLVQDNNRMLHAARRNAVIGGILKFLVYAGLLIVLPLWLYATYLAPIVESALQTAQQIQGTGAAAQAQFGQLQGLLDSLDVRQFLGQ